MRVAISYAVPPPKARRGKEALSSIYGFCLTAQNPDGFSTPLNDPPPVFNSPG